MCDYRQGDYRQGLTVYRYQIPVRLRPNSGATPYIRAKLLLKILKKQLFIHTIKSAEGWHHHDSEYDALVHWNPWNRAVAFIFG